MLLKPLSVSLLLASLMGCGQVAPPSSAPRLYEDSCAGLFTAYATWAEGCLGARLPDAEKHDLLANCNVRAAIPGIHVAPAAFSDCAGKVAASSCAVLPVECLTREDIGSVESTFLGTGVDSFDYELFPRAAGAFPMGASCSLSAECLSGACSGSPNACGACIAVARLGEPCDAQHACAGSLCESGVCVDPGLPEGSACWVNGGGECQAKLRCTGLNGVCVARLGLGVGCTEDTNGFTEPCIEGATCSGSVCTAIEEAGPGERCDYRVHPCVGELYGCFDGVCRKPIADVPEGGSCTRDACATGLHCVSDTCEAPVDEGGPCGELASCVTGLSCLRDSDTSNHCGLGRAEGAECWLLGECASGFECKLGKGGGKCEAIYQHPIWCTDALPCSEGETCRSGVCIPLAICSEP
jgi:hypothetical protein